MSSKPVPGFFKVVNPINHCAFAISGVAALCNKRLRMCTH